MFVALLGVISAARWVIESRGSYVSGLDGGNWLAYGHGLFGEHLRSDTLKYPPLVPSLVVVGERLFGTYAGVQVVAILAGAVMAAGAYVLLYEWGLKWRAALLAAALASSAGTAEATAWGGYPQLIGLGLLPLFVLALDRFLASSRLTAAGPSALVLLLALSTNEFIGPLTAVIGAIYAAIRYVTLRNRSSANSAKNLFIGAAVHGILPLPLLPIYLGLIPGIQSNERTKLTEHGSQLVVSALETVTRDLPTLWALALVIAVIAPVLIATRADRLAALAGSTLVPALLLLALAGEDRLAYVVPVGIVIGLAAWVSLAAGASTWVRRIVDVGLITLVTLDLMTGVQYFAQVRDFYTVLNPGVVQGFSQLSQISAEGDVIAVSPTAHDWELGWWVEGAAHRLTIDAGSPIYLNYADEKARNAVANQIFVPGIGPTESIRRAKAAGARFLLVDKKWSGYSAWIVGGSGPNAASPIFENESVAIYATGN